MGLHNTHIIHVLNYTRNILKLVDTKHQKTFSSPFSRLLPNTLKMRVFQKMFSRKINHFPENIITETNRA